jgi:hypothetical protein
VSSDEQREKKYGQHVRVEQKRKRKFSALTESPKRQNLGFSSPTTEATTGPEWNPQRIRTLPRSGRPGAMGTRAAASRTSSAKRATRSEWSGCGACRLPTTCFIFSRNIL